MIATGLLRMPRDPSRFAAQANLLTGRRVAELVAEQGRIDYLAAVLELAARHDLSTGASLAAIRRARIAGHVRVDADGFLVLPAECDAP